MTVKEIEALLALAEAATPGEWMLSPCSHGGLILQRRRIPEMAFPGQSIQIVPEADARFIAAARKSVQKLCREVLQARKDWLAMLRAIAVVAPDETRWDEADDDALLEEFDPWDELRRLRAEIDEIKQLRAALRRLVDAEVARFGLVVRNHSSGCDCRVCAARKALGGKR